MSNDRLDIDDTGDSGYIYNINSFDDYKNRIVRTRVKFLKLS